MRLRLLTTVTLAGALITAACASEPDAPGTDDITRSMLSQPANDGLSTTLLGDPPQPTGPTVQVTAVGFNRGGTDALVKVVELSDYGCGYCRKFHLETYPTLLAEFIESGMVEWKFVPYITGMFDNSLAATEAAECVNVQDAEAFEALNSVLWAEQSAWKGSGDPDAVIHGWVQELGIDVVAFDGCMANDELTGRVAASTTLARQLGVRGTPTFVVIGYPPLQGALPLDMFQRILSAVHAEALEAAEGQE